MWKECLKEAGKAKDDNELEKAIQRGNRAVMARLRNEEVRKAEVKVSL